MVRHARPTDLDALGQVEQSAATLFQGTHMSWAVTITSTPSETYLPALEHSLLWVVDVGELVGFVAASHQKDRILIEELSVARAFQRRGFGRALLDTAVADATRLQKRAVGLTTDRDLPWNRLFYESAGFHVVPDNASEIWLLDRLRLEAQHGQSQQTSRSG